MLGNITKFAKRAPPGFTPPNLPKNFFKFAKLFRIGAVLSVAGIGLFIGTLIAEKVRGDEIKKELQKSVIPPFCYVRTLTQQRRTITDLSATRFVVKQMQMLLKRTENLIGEAEAYIILEDSLSNPNLDEAMQQLLKETIMKPAMESMMASYESVRASPRGCPRA